MLEISPCAAEPMQSIVHGDAKGANILYASDEAGQATPLVYDFQSARLGPGLNLT